MVFAYTCFLVVIIGRSIEFILEMIYKVISHCIKSMKHRRNGEAHSSSAYKRLSADVTYSLHEEVVSMAAFKGMTIKEYVLGAVMTRLKLDIYKKNNKDKSIKDYQKLGE